MNEPNDNFLGLWHKIQQSPKWLQILLALLAIYIVYLMATNPIARLFFSGVWAIIPFLFKMVFALLKFFIVLIVFQFVFLKLIKESLHRKVAWLCVLVAISLLNEFQVFGHFSWNPLKIKSSIEYLLLQMQFLCFYYVIVLLILPKFLWNGLTKMFITLLTFLTFGVSLIPIVGTVMGTILNAVVAFSLLTFFVLNLVGEGLILMEKTMLPKPQNTPEL